MLLKTSTSGGQIPLAIPRGRSIQCLLSYAVCYDMHMHLAGAEAAGFRVFEMAASLRLCRESGEIEIRLRVVLIKKVRREAYAEEEKGPSADGRGWRGRRNKLGRLKLGLTHRPRSGPYPLRYHSVRKIYPFSHALPMPQDPSWVSALVVGFPANM